MMNNGMQMQGNYMNGGMPMQEFVPRPRMNQEEQKENNNQQKGNAKPLRITMPPQDFESVIDSKVTTTAKLAKTVSTIMKTAFSDFEGCIILPDNSGRLSAALYFKDKQDDSDRVKALQPVVGRRSNTSAYQRISNWNIRTRDKVYDLSQQAKEILSEFIPKGKNGKINWNNVMCEQSQFEYNMQTIYVQVFGLDINRLVKKIYGSKVKKGDSIERYEYNVTPLKPIISGMNPSINIPKDFIIKIERLNTKEVEEIAKMVGTIPMTGAIPMIR